MKNKEFVKKHLEKLNGVTYNLDTVLVFLINTIQKYSLAAEDTYSINYYQDDFEQKYEIRRFTVFENITIKSLITLDINYKDGIINITNCFVN